MPKFMAPVLTEAGDYLGEVALPFPWRDRDVVRLAKHLPCPPYIDESVSVDGTSPIEVVTLEVRKWRDQRGNHVVLRAPNGTTSDDIGAR